jgi:hypothetical protein
MFNSFIDLGYYEDKDVKIIHKNKNLKKGP